MIADGWDQLYGDAGRNTCLVQVYQAVIQCTATLPLTKAQSFGTNGPVHLRRQGHWHDPRYLVTGYQDRLRLLEGECV